MAQLNDSQQLGTKALSPPLWWPAHLGTHSIRSHDSQHPHMCFSGGHTLRKIFNDYPTIRIQPWQVNHKNNCGNTEAIVIWNIFVMYLIHLMRRISVQGIGIATQNIEYQPRKQLF